MARGKSGRIVIEINPRLKQKLYANLALEGQTLKEWFLMCVENFIRESLIGELSSDTEKTKKLVRIQQKNRGGLE
jgi:hypothetical protein